MSVSTVPLPTAFFHPILRLLSEHPEGLRRRDLHEPVADVMGLTAEQRAEVFQPASGGQAAPQRNWLALGTQHAEDSWLCRVALARDPGALRPKGKILLDPPLGSTT